MNNIKIGLVVADTEEYVGLYETIKEFKETLFQNALIIAFVPIIWCVRP